jgi:mono/diheme cytochrome c family protein
MAMAADVAPEAPHTWVVADIQSGTLPPPVRGATITPIGADYYYRMPEYVMFKRYPVYASGREPAGYLERLSRADPEVTFDPKMLRTDDDWIRAGQEVFRYPIALFPMEQLAVWRDILKACGISPARDGTFPQLSIVVPSKGNPMAGFLSCATCHTRVQPDGTVIEGGQGSVPDLLLGFPPVLEVARAFQRALFRVPWIENDPVEQFRTMSMEQINAIKVAIPVGVVGRNGSSLFSPVQIPDLIGVKDLRYLDHTGLMLHRGPADLMRYAALNQGADMWSDYMGYRPTGFLRGSDMKDDNLPLPETQGRYSDAQLFALTKFLYALKPPVNPNRRTTLSLRGERVFSREGCARCHTPPLYTSNKLTPARGFSVPERHRKLYAIEDTVVATDPTLTMRTRRGTGYYKVPSLRGVWYRGPFEHNGSVAALEDWFDPRRLRSDYVPTGYKGSGAATRAVPGHLFGLTLSADDKAALIAFLKTL